MSPTCTTIETMHSFRSASPIAALMAVLILAGCSASTESDASSGKQDISSSSSGSITSVAYSDLGNLITVTGKTNFWEGVAELSLKNESDPSVNTKQPGSGDEEVLAMTSARGPNGLSPFRADFQTGNAGEDTVPTDGQCIGVYLGTMRGDLVNIGAFSYCKDRLNGAPSECGSTKIYSSSEACLAEKARLVSVSYSDLGNAVEVHGQASFFEGQATILVRNETSSANNSETPGFPGPEYRSFAQATVHGGGNGIAPFDASFQAFDIEHPEAASARKGDCVGVYQVRGGRGGVTSLGVFKYEPDVMRNAAPTPRRYFYTAAECFKAN